MRRWQLPDLASRSKSLDVEAILHAILLLSRSCLGRNESETMVALSILLFMLSLVLMHDELYFSRLRLFKETLFLHERPSCATRQTFVKDSLTEAIFSHHPPAAAQQRLSRLGSGMRRVLLLLAALLGIVAVVVSGHYEWLAL